ncbi:hypothetical protein F5B18DRAFT_620183 [Nemania serpens]|nr:hypothetical protein F5B18DRAFT_620183 [Nemania serpens]
MRTSIYYPKPQRPAKRAFLDIDPDPDYNPVPISKHARRVSTSPTPRATPTRHHDLEIARPRLVHDHQTARSASAPPESFQASGRKRKRGHGHPQRPLDSQVRAWLVDVLGSTPRPAARVLGSRSSSCPPSLDLSKGKNTPPSLATIRQMSRQMSRRTSQQMSEDGYGVGSGSGSSPSGKLSTSHPLYRGTLYHNGIHMDYSGRQIPADLEAFVETHILKQRDSPPLGDEAVARVTEVAEELADSTEGLTAKLMRTEMFPLDRPGIEEGGNSPWSTVALPDNPEYQYAVAAPKPDVHFGYPTNQRSSWSATQSNVITHPVARPYTQPARGDTFPFVSVEMKSEAAGGTLYVAENQAAGSGSHCVNALLWLLQQAGSYDGSTRTDTIAFTIAMSHRQAIFYLHWYSELDRRYYMSLLTSYSSMVPADIRACNNTVKNILDFGLGPRKTTISAALDALFPFPTQWKQARSASTASSTPAARSSIQDIGPQPNKVGTNGILSS